MSPPIISVIKNAGINIIMSDENLRLRRFIKSCFVIVIKKRAPAKFFSLMPDILHVVSGYLFPAHCGKAYPFAVLEETRSNKVHSVRVLDDVDFDLLVLCAVIHLYLH